MTKLKFTSLVGSLIAAAVTSPEANGTFVVEQFKSAPIAASDIKDGLTTIETLRRPYIDEDDEVSPTSEVLGKMQSALVQNAKRHNIALDSKYDDWQMTDERLDDEIGDVGAANLADKSLNGKGDSRRHVQT